MRFWNKNTESTFFREAIEKLRFPRTEQLFYKLQNGYFAYALKGQGTEGQIIDITARKKRIFQKQKNF